MQLNFFIAMALAGLVPLILGAIWYNPKVFGTAWMNVNGFSEDKLKEGFNMPLVFGLTFVFGCLIAFALAPVVIHQFGFFGMLQKDFMSADTQAFMKQGMETYGNDFRTFKHGALHGTITGIGIGLPLVGINALFERRGFKYITIHAGYWIACLCLMGGILCQFVNMNSLG